MAKIILQLLGETVFIYLSVQSTFIFWIPKIYVSDFIDRNSERGFSNKNIYIW